MLLTNLLVQNKAAILQRWLNLIVESYPAEASPFLKEANRFTNPAGYVICEETARLLEELLKAQGNSGAICASLENIMRIRAVQDFSPEEAMGFIFLLKRAIIEEVGEEIGKGPIFREWLDFEHRIDEVACASAGTYLKCRERIYELKLNEVKAERDGVFNLLGRIHDKGAAMLR